VYELDENGRYNPVPERFPSAMVNGRNLGFQALGEYVHAQGLKFGIHIVRGIPRESVKQNLPVAGSRFHAQDVADTTDACPGIRRIGEFVIRPPARPGTTHCSHNTRGGESTISKSIASPTIPTSPRKSECCTEL